MYVYLVLFLMICEYAGECNNTLIVFTLQFEFR